MKLIDIASPVGIFLLGVFIIFISIVFSNVTITIFETNIAEKSPEIGQVGVILLVMSIVMWVSVYFLREVNLLK
ncbi:MAG: hypothetical protein ABIH11_05610 [Candidatus Altiarchaeota archaeon]